MAWDGGGDHLQRDHHRLGHLGSQSPHDRCHYQGDRADPAPGGPVCGERGLLGSRSGAGHQKNLVITYKYHGTTSTITVPASQSLGYQRLVQNASGGTAVAGAAPEPPSLTEEQLAGVVLIEGDKGVATGFLAKVHGVLCVVTNQHVLGNNEKVTVKDMEGQVVAVQSILGAVGADIALLRVANPSKVSNPLDLATTCRSPPRSGPVMVVAPLGGGVATLTSGRLRASAPHESSWTLIFSMGTAAVPFSTFTPSKLSASPPTLKPTLRRRWSSPAAEKAPTSCRRPAGSVSGSTR